MPKSAKKKSLSPARVAAMKAVEAAKSPQEKLVASQQLKKLKFLEIVVPRVNRSLAGLRSIAKLANRSAYSWDPEQADKIVRALAKEINAVSDKLTGTKVEAEKFTL